MKYLILMLLSGVFIPCFAQERYRLDVKTFSEWWKGEISGEDFKELIAV